MRSHKTAIKIWPTLKFSSVHWKCRIRNCQVLLSFLGALHVCMWQLWTENEIIPYVNIEKEMSSAFVTESGMSLFSWISRWYYVSILLLCNSSSLACSVSEIRVCMLIVLHWRNHIWKTYVGGVSVHYTYAFPDDVGWSQAIERK